MGNKALAFVIGIISVMLLISIFYWGKNIVTHIANENYVSTGIEAEEVSFRS
ncbi:MAG: hypothetical protein K6B14_04855 [Lachnospiraceae bacterium]|nr:hypothetical protein [Lachnospiraceae bacterium]